MGGESAFQGKHAKDGSWSPCYVRKWMGSKVEVVFEGHPGEVEVLDVMDSLRHSAAPVTGASCLEIKPTDVVSACKKDSKSRHWINATVISVDSGEGKDDESKYTFTVEWLDGKSKGKQEILASSAIAVIPAMATPSRPLCKICGGPGADKETTHVCQGSACGGAAYHDSCLSTKPSGDESAWMCPECSVGDEANQVFLPVGMEPDVPPTRTGLHGDTCGSCGSGSQLPNIVLCDGCDASTHLNCMHPKLQRVPEGGFLCASCVPEVAKGLLMVAAARNDDPTKHKRAQKLQKAVKFDEVMGPAREMEIDSVLGCRRRPAAVFTSPGGPTLEYYVKIRDSCHRKDLWLPAPAVRVWSPSKLAAFRAENGLTAEAPEMEPRVPPDWLLPDRVVTERGSKSKREYLVKWRGLGYEGATWEAEKDLAYPEAAAELERYRDLQARLAKASPKQAAKGSKLAPAGPYPSVEGTPSCVGGGALRLLSFQVQGVNYLLDRLAEGTPCVLADEPPLSPAVQACAMLAVARDRGQLDSPALVVAPASAIPGWAAELRAWAPALSVVQFSGGALGRHAAMDNEFRNGRGRWRFDVLLVSYDTATHESKFLKAVDGWAVVIVDEAHRPETAPSQLSAKLAAVPAASRVALTGCDAPPSSDLVESLRLLSLIDPENYPCPEAALAQYRADAAAGVDHGEALRGVLVARTLRRTRADVAPGEVPRSTIRRVACPMGRAQHRLYKELVVENYDSLNADGAHDRFLRVLDELVACLAHPSLSTSPSAASAASAGKDMWQASGKVAVLRQLAGALVQQGRRVVVFSRLARALDVIESVLAAEGLSISKLVCGLAADERKSRIDSFNAEDSSVQVLLVSTQAGALGVSPAAADTVIVFDPDFSPFSDPQAQPRVHRMGQEVDTVVYHLVTQATVEEDMHDAAAVASSHPPPTGAAEAHAVLRRGVGHLLQDGSGEPAGETAPGLADSTITASLDRTSSRPGDVEDGGCPGRLGCAGGAGSFAPEVAAGGDQAGPAAGQMAWAQYMQEKYNNNTDNGAQAQGGGGGAAGGDAAVGVSGWVDTPCAVCGDAGGEGSMVTCGDCGSAQHKSCAGEPPEGRPAEAGPWFCPKCALEPSLRTRLRSLLEATRMEKKEAEADPVADALTPEPLAMDVDHPSAAAPIQKPETKRRKTGESWAAEVARDLKKALKAEGTKPARLSDKALQMAIFEEAAACGIEVPARAQRKGGGAPGTRRAYQGWTPPEELLLKQLVQTHPKENGRFPWRQMLTEGQGTFLPGRTVVDLKDKWRNLVKSGAASVADVGSQAPGVVGGAEGGAGGGALPPPAASAPAGVDANAGSVVVSDPSISAQLDAAAEAAAAAAAVQVAVAVVVAAAGGDEAAQAAQDAAQAEAAAAEAAAAAAAAASGSLAQPGPDGEHPGMSSAISPHDEPMGTPSAAPQVPGGTPGADTTPRPQGTPRGTPKAGSENGTPGVRRAYQAWTPEEESLLKSLVERHPKENGRYPWRLMLTEGAGTFLEGRTVVDLKDKWRNLSKAMEKGVAQVQAQAASGATAPLGGSAVAAVSGGLPAVGSKRPAEDVVPEGLPTGEGAPKMPRT